MVRPESYDRSGLDKAAALEHIDDMRKRSRTVNGIVERLESAGLQIIPRGQGDSYIRGELGPRQLDLLQDVLPDLKANWQEVLKLLANRDPNEAAAATVRILSGEENPAVVLGRRGGLKGGPARAASLSKKRRIDLARLAAQARWSKVKASD